MAKIKLTKNEQKKQKDALKRYLRYLPTLMLKKQQLQLEIRRVESQQQARLADRSALTRELESWVSVFGEQSDLAPLLRLGALHTETGNIAGVDIPLFQSVETEEKPYDLFLTPLWVDAALEIMRKLAALDAEVAVLSRQARLLGEELRITSQRVNLFEKVKIPEARENIRKIQIYLGDQQTAAVVRGKIAKGKLLRVNA
ncbi:MAG: V-type ATP synthase subunit D [Spirochaetes bacterium RBG_16_67_19]|nr:MAG: V-type ATP synthase subunit D [Spirochaetes bacterium RBG_16_67_19]